ncbi:DUF4270 family protein [Sphingobacterium chuzhouense]|uniref:DUF4270 family protein n=1 Tax=Sphingobacterium chuzhouense TaxID=1742264 RepID=A0ABR7XXZ7_9SPHI|nr:DUF4270 family protein [Sphingobacterium chuzhouense]MBD1423934.1 DUF4270 family protein [Sphingobacterium chuzhouense]
MNRFLKRSIHFFAIPFFTLIIVAACDKDMSVMLDNSATSNVGVTLIDSFTVNTSTVQLANLPSAGTGNILVGKATVPQSGSVKSTSYFRIGLTSTANDIPETARFDSITLVLKPTATPYSFGDTTKMQKITVHQLTEALATKTPTPLFPNQALPLYVIGNTIFTDQTFGYNSTPIGTISFRPRMHTLDSLSIRLADAIGQDFFTRIKAGNIQVTSYDNFKEYFKGLVLVPDEENTAVAAFNDVVEVRINYNYPSADGHKRTGFKTLGILEPGFQYNNIVTDRTETAFEELSAKKAIPTSSTSGLTYVQSGSGTVAKISLPTLKEFLQAENIAVNKAELVIETSSKTNTMYPVPSNLVLSINDQDGVPRSVLQSVYSSGTQYAVLVPGVETGRNGTYTFDLMMYLQQLKSTQIYDNTSFYLMENPNSTTQGQNEIIPPDLFRSFNTAFIASENSKPKIKLNILYTKFR